MTTPEIQKKQVVSEYQASTTNQNTTIQNLDRTIQNLRTALQELAQRREAYENEIKSGNRRSEERRRQSIDLTRSLQPSSIEQLDPDKHSEERTRPLEAIRRPQLGGLPSFTGIIHSQISSQGSPQEGGLVPVSSSSSMYSIISPPSEQSSLEQVETQDGTPSPRSEPQSPTPMGSPPPSDRNHSVDGFNTEGHQYTSLLAPNLLGQERGPTLFSSTHHNPSRRSPQPLQYEDLSEVTPSPSESPLPPRSIKTALTTQTLGSRHLSTSPTSKETCIDQLGTYPANPRISPTPSVEETSSVIETSRPASPAIAPARVALPSNATPSGHFKAKIKWCNLEYIVEQDLPQETTQEDWQAIVKAYEQILNATENSPVCHPGIDRLQLSLDRDSGEMNIEITTKQTNPSVPTQRVEAITIPIRGQIVNDLIDYHTTHNSHALQFYRSEETLPDSEIIHTPLGLVNTTGTLCYANALLQMIMAYPRLKDTIATYSDHPLLTGLIHTYANRSATEIEISSLDNSSLEDIIQGTVSSVHRQEDILDAFELLIKNASSEQTVYENLSASLPFIEQIFRATEGQTEIPEGATQQPNQPNLFSRSIQNTRSQLPILSLNPDPTHRMTLSEAISKSSEWEDHIPPPPDAIPTMEAPLVAERKRFISAPQTLVIHANRTSGNGSTGKNQGKITLSEKVALPGSLVGKENTPPLYQLRSFAVHIGNQSTHGHYVAYVKVKGLDGKTLYYEMDDSSKKQITQKEFLLASENFALAFYDNISEVTQQTGRQTSPPKRKQQESNVVEVASEQEPD